MGTIIKRSILFSCLLFILSQTITTRIFSTLSSGKDNDEQQRERRDDDAPDGEKQMTPTISGTTSRTLETVLAYFLEDNKEDDNDDEKKNLRIIISNERPTNGPVHDGGTSSHTSVHPSQSYRRDDDDHPHNFKRFHDLNNGSGRHNDRQYGLSFIDEKVKEEDQIDNNSITEDFRDSTPLPLSNNAVEVSALSSRVLSPNSAKVGIFQRLDCNPETFSDCNSTVSSYLSSSSGNNPFIVPCGQCYSFDLTGDVTLVGGLNIMGKLIFPDNHQVTIFTPYVIVQGELELTVNHPLIEPGNIGTNFILTGTENVKFTPTESPNKNACDNFSNNECDLGVKPFVVAGGKVNINAMPETCATHTTVKSTIYKKPVYSPNISCDELISNGDAEGNDFSSYPMATSFSSLSLLVIEENGNTFWRLSNREKRKHSIQYTLDTTCLTRGVTYEISSRVRYNHKEEFEDGYESHYWYIDFKRALDGNWIEQKIVTCDPQSVAEGWVTCSGLFMIDEEMAESTEAQLKMALDNSRDGDEYDLDFDDIRISYHQGYMDELVVDTDDASCWGVGADIHVTTASFYSSISKKSNGFESQIASTVDNGDGTMRILLDKVATLPVISEEENSDYAVDIALLSRNVVVKGESGEDKKGGYMQILHTSMIAQTIQGVEFRNMGRASEIDKFPLQLLYSGNMEGTLIDRNSFRESNQRCISVEGSSNVTISHNTAYKNKGHCVYIGFESESNLIANNLVSDTIDLSYSDRLSGDSDYDACAFMNRYNPNHYVNNIAVAAERHGFYFRNERETRLEDETESSDSVRKLPLGTFSNNIAKSNKYSGMEFQYHESDELVLLSNIKAIKNRYEGLYIYSSRNVTIHGALFADNTQRSVRVRWTDYLKIQDTVISGIATETKESAKPPYFRKPCVDSDMIPPVGLQMPTGIQNWDANDNIGSILTNVTFNDFDHSDECETSIPVGFFPEDNNNNHFDYLTMFESVTFNGYKIMDTLSSDAEGVKDIVINDIDGKSDPFGKASHGVLVNNLNRLRAFAGGTCTKHPRGVSYCPNTCYRTVTFMVDQIASEDFDLRVTRTIDGQEISVPYSYKLDEDAHKKLYYKNYRFFSVSLPEGSYTVDFLKDFQPAWPQFVLPRWEGIPRCNDYVSTDNLIITKPARTCDELIINGDMELGTNLWYHMNAYGTDRGGLVAAPGEGVGSSAALRYYDRYSSSDGPGQNLDTRCLHQNLNGFFEIELYFRLEEESVPFICDPFNDDIAVRCPCITFRQERYDGNNLKVEYKPHLARVVVPNNLGEFNLVHGVFKVDESIHVLERLFLYLEGAHKQFDVLIDNVSVTKIDGACGGNLIRNGDFEEYGKFWRNYGDARLDIQESASNKVLKVFDMVGSDQGARQSLYIQKGCLVENDRYALTGKFRIEDAYDGTAQECDRTVSDGELECSNILIWADDSTGSAENIKYAETVAVSGDIQQGWSIMAGIVTVTEILANHDEIYIRLYGPHPNMNIYYDDVSLIPLSKSCNNLVLNGDFEIGDSRFWEPSSRSSINVDISLSGADGSNYSMMVQKYTSNRIRQLLDSRCFIEGQEFQINAKFRLLDATNLALGMDCDPSVVSVYNSNACPSIKIRGTECVNDDIVYLFWNDIDNFQWDINDFNSFENTFAVGPEMASCNKVYIEVGHRTHEGRVLLVDDIQMSQRTTSPPTQNPTFSPTKSKNSGPTSQPTVKTDAPTTTNSLSCPPVGSPPINVPPGSVMLGYGDTLCTLTKNIISSTSGSASSIPVALSYDGNPWEQSAGEFATSFFANKDILCYSNGCQINLPPLGVRESYVLTTLDYSLAENEEYARFLETATFGITEEQLDAFKNSPASVHDDIITWISDQMNSTITPLTSHREFWRKGTIGRFPTSTSEATGDHPCDLYSRWRKMSFVSHEKESFLRVIGEGPFRLEMDGWLRTIVTNFTVEEQGYSTYSFNSNFEYELCRSPEEEIGGNLYLRLQDGKCVPVQENPLVNLDGFESSVNYIVDLPDNSLHPIDQFWTEGDDLIYRMNISLFNNPAFSETCSSLPSVPQNSDGPVFGRLSDGTWLMFDPRINLETNTMVEPISDGGKQTSINSNGETYCSNVPRTFLNENECKLSMDACKASSESSRVEILLDNSTIVMLNNLTGRYAYAIQGLLVNYDGIILEHPCTPGLRSRWERKNPIGCDATELYDATNETLSHLLSDSGDGNPFIRDIYFPEEGAYCNSSDTEPEIEIEVDGECWTRVHPEHMSIFDMTYWVDNHPGGPYAIQKWSENNGAILVYPSTLEGKVHGMSRWNNNWHKFTYIGRFGDHLSLGDLPTNLRGLDVMNYFGSTQGSDSSKVLVCGSPGEVGNNKKGKFKFDMEGGNSRKFVWTMIALDSKDQLRQRVSWALSQILVIVKQSIGTQNLHSEHFLAYYDIFVRNAFGNYRDVLKEISYSPLMAESLTFLGSKSSAYTIANYRMRTSADENFAREIMQLFTMGVLKLNMDGSPKLDENGNTMLTYTVDDIQSLSRAWTGFKLQLQRGNILGIDNEVDPMRIGAEWRDRFPKTDTEGGYIGDSYPLCSDFPSKAFLRKGAKYRLLGSSSLSQLMKEYRNFNDNEEIRRFVLDEQSSLRSLLCDKNQAGECNFKSSISLETNHGCTGIECDVDTVRVVQVDTNIFYEYIQPPCVTFPFYNNPVKISQHKNSLTAMCADPRLAVATEACCSIGNNNGVTNSKYSGERVKFETAEIRCRDVSQLPCNSIASIVGPDFVRKGYFWTSDSCLLQVKIRRDGSLTIVHKPSRFLERVEHVSIVNENFFKVYWERGGNYPTVDNDCDGVCEVLSEESTCLCTTGVLENIVFGSMPSGKAEIIEKLNIGGLDPSIFDTGIYSSINGSNGDFIAHLKDNEFSSETIFEYKDDKGRTFFMKNVHSSVHLRGISGDYIGQSFRNSPQFMSFIPSETNLRDAQYETEAVLDHYFFHDNTPPFLAMRLIQRLVMSNPGPRYIQIVAEAFKSGSYMSGETIFGTGRYGDLASTFAAIYLDRAARNILLDKDVSSGAIREPILKVLSLVRSMEFVSHAPIIMTHGVVQKIGQMAHEFDSVFSFFQPEYRPHGRVGDASLVSPEAKLLDMPKIVGLLNSLTSMIKYGLSSCEGGLGRSECVNRSRYLLPTNGFLEFNKTFVGSENEFSFETFEGPSLKGGFDNRWVGRGFHTHNGKTTIDPLDSNNHVLHFPKFSFGPQFFGPLIQNLASNSNSLVVKFRYLALRSKAGGCIGYVDGSKEYPTDETWALCDNSFIMDSNGIWKSCQFVIPSELSSFRIAIADRKRLGGNAYFDDIQIGSGNTTACAGVDVPKNAPPGQKGYSNAVVDKLSTLLTAGRLGSSTKSIIVDAFDSAESADDGLAIAQQLIVTTSEFHTTNSLSSTDQEREKFTFPQSTVKPYKAVIFLMLKGGCDSFNMLIPHTCSNNLYESYVDTRQQVAIQKDLLLPISATNQVCSRFGLHPKLSLIQSLYDDGDLLFFANTGVMSQPVNKDNYYELTNVHLFSHNHMQRETERIDPYKVSSGTGILGRVSDVLSQHGCNTGSFSIQKNSVALAGRVSNPPITVDGSGFPHLYLSDDVKNIVSKLHNNTNSDSGIFADLWSTSLMKSIENNEFFSNLLDNVDTTTTFPDHGLGNGMRTIAKLIATRDVRGVDVDTFYIEETRFDTHSNVGETLDELFSRVNGALSAFSEEMKSMNLWNNVTLIQMSEFARSLNPNGNNGTDHAWGGHYMMMGGAVKGRQVLGKYPEDLSNKSPLVLSRGRVIPTTPWDSPFSGIASWLGIGPDNIDKVCTNLHQFNSSHLIPAGDMFTELAPTSTLGLSSELTLNPSSSPSVFHSAIPTAEATTQPPIVSLYAMAVCGGATFKCKPQSEVAPKTATYGVRCCNDTVFPASKKKLSCSVWGGSRVGNPRGCVKSATFQEAVDYCTASGARLCTKKELLAKCARGTGCRLNRVLVWSSEPAAVA